MLKRSSSIFIWMTLVLIGFFYNSCTSEHNQGNGPKLSKKCKGMLEKLAKKVSNFTKCAVREATPFRFCRNCHNQYGAVREVRNKIYEPGFGCLKELVQSEKYQIVSHVYEFTTGLWSGSNCDNCFKSSDSSSWKDWVVSYGVKEYFIIQDVVDQCFFNNSHNPLEPINNSSSNASSANISMIIEVCTKCESVYLQLKKTYKNVIESGGGYDKESAVCADVVSAMNFTRQRWSDFNCVKIQRDLVSVVALTCFFCIIPIIFYTAAKLNGDSQERRAGSGLPKIDYDSQ